MEERIAELRRRLAADPHDEGARQELDHALQRLDGIARVPLDSMDDDGRSHLLVPLADDGGHETDRPTLRHVERTFDDFDIEHYLWFAKATRWLVAGLLCYIGLIFIIAVTASDPGHSVDLLGQLLIAATLCATMRMALWRLDRINERLAARDEETDDGR